MKTEKEIRKELIATRKALVNLTNSVGLFLRELDKAMQVPESNQRGKQIAELMNKLEYQRDYTRYFTLGIDYRHDPEIVGDNQRIFKAVTK